MHKIKPEIELKGKAEKKVREKELVLMLDEKAANRALPKGGRQTWRGRHRHLFYRCLTRSLLEKLASA